MKPEVWNGAWPGTVISDRDPERRCRLQVRLDQVYGAAADPARIPDELLPWAEACVPCTGFQSGIVAVPSIGAAVWVMFWGGDPERPIWMGGWIAPADAVPAHQLAYAAGGPTSYHLRTPEGQEIQLRWSPGNEGIELSTSAGDRCLLSDVGSALGRMVQVSTKEGTSLTLDGATQRITVTGLGDVQSAVAGAVTVDVQGPVVFNAVQGVTRTLGSLVETVLGGTVKTFMGAFAAEFMGVVGVTVAGVFSFTGAGLALLTTGAALALGSVAGASRQALVTQDFIDFFNAHTHVTPSGGGASEKPTVPALPDQFRTQYVVAD